MKEKSKRTFFYNIMRALARFVWTFMKINLPFCSYSLLHTNSLLHLESIEYNHANKERGSRRYRENTTLSHLSSFRLMAIIPPSFLPRTFGHVHMSLLIVRSQGEQMDRLLSSMTKHCHSKLNADRIWNPRSGQVLTTPLSVVHTRDSTLTVGNKARVTVHGVKGKKEQTSDLTQDRVKMSGLVFDDSWKVERFKIFD